MLGSQTQRGSGRRAAIVSRLLLLDTWRRFKLCSALRLKSAEAFIQEYACVCVCFEDFCFPG